MIKQDECPQILVSKEDKQGIAHIDTTAKEDCVKSTLSHTYYPWRFVLKTYGFATESSWHTIARVASSFKHMARAYVLQMQTIGVPLGASSPRGTLRSFSMIVDLSTLF